ncbi:MAG TPA: DUF423 domain-containing protein [Devosiaceae bacterium]|jgi:uncharacterized membrane protein YgdD (TMEM256/DUF423 family)
MTAAPTDSFSRIILASAGLFGALGIAAAAGATHSGNAQFLGPASTICLAHAPTLLALGLMAPRNTSWKIAMVLLAVGTLVFVGDLGMRQFSGVSLFPLAAPAGGSLLIAGWLVTIFAAMFARR